MPDAPAHLPASFSSSDEFTATGPRGQIARRELIDHTTHFERKLWNVRPGVWSLVGNGLSNQSFIEGPDGLIVIDTGESTEEMAAALSEVRKETSAPVAGVIYTHFHYIYGTKAIADNLASQEIPIWGHERIPLNLARIGTEVSAAASRGLIQQFGILLPPDGEDGLVNVGLGNEFRSPDHAPYSPGYLPPTHVIRGEMSTQIAGLQVEFSPAPSDADDSITIWFPELGVCVNNLVWPALFNVFAIRGEEYRDPRILLAGLDHIAALEPEYLVGAHGPPLSGRDRIRQEVIEYRDAIQFLWDQTVRGINRGLTATELCEFVQLPNSDKRGYLTTQFYGLVEHHVRQIHAGLRGWFDGDEAQLFPLPPVERARKLVAGFGGEDSVRKQIEKALTANDLRWALELATWLVRLETNPAGRADAGTEADRGLLATVLRAIAQRTTSANIRNWCLTRALELEGHLSLDRFRVQRFGRNQVLSTPPAAIVHALRVLLDPERAAGVDDEICWRFAGGETAGLRVRNHVAVPTDGSDAEVGLELGLEAWADVMSGKLQLQDALDQDTIRSFGDRDRLRQLLQCFDHPTLAI